MRPRCFLAIVQITSGPGGPVPKFGLRSSMSCLYLSELDDARDDRENISLGRGTLFLETINAPSNRAWKITSERNRREKETVGKELFVRLPVISLNCEIGQVSPSSLLPRRKIS